MRRIEFGALPRERHTDPENEWPAGLRKAVGQLEEYFAKERRAFDLDLDLSGVTSDFQHEVYRRLLDVPHGHVISYGQIAKDIGKPDQARAVGQAVGATRSRSWCRVIVSSRRMADSRGSRAGSR